MPLISPYKRLCYYNNMDYQIGSLADLITGSNTPNKRKVFQSEISPQPEANAVKKRRTDNLTSKTHVAPKHKSLRKKHRETAKLSDAQLQKKAGSTKRNGATESDFDQEHVEKEKAAGLYNDRTVFVGNVSVKTSKSKLKKLFEQFGKIEAIRFRCIPLADPRTPKKVASIKKEFHPDRQALHSYIRFATRDEALKALAFNGHTYNDLHLRVNICDETEKPATLKAVFIGNIPFDAEEEDLWNLFEGCGSIESVRLVRDSRTNVGKGFGYVNFKSPDAVHLALEMGEVKLKNRVLRVSQCKKTVSAKMRKKKRLEPKPNIKKKNKKTFKIMQNKNSSGEPGQEKNDETAAETSQNSAFRGKVFVEKKKKKKFDKEAHRKKKMADKIAPR